MDLLTLLLSASLGFMISVSLGLIGRYRKKMTGDE